METKTAKFIYHFMVGHRVHSLVIDGAEIKRV
jgi:hypothetical protein